PEGDRRAGLNHLKATLRWLRQELEPADVPFGTILVADRTTVGLQPEAVTTDVAEFELALQAIRRSESEAELTRLLTQTVELYQGELLPGCSEDWVLQERLHLAELYFEALSQLLLHLE